MRLCCRGLLVCLVGLLGLLLWVVSPAFADESSSGASMALSSGPLVIVGSPEEGSQLQAEHQARVADPELAAAREASRTEYAGATSEVQSKVALDAFTSLLSTPLGGMPSLPDGERIGRYLSAHAATVDLPEGRQGVVESLQPIAVEQAGGGTVPIDLRPKEAGGAFEPSTPPAGLSVRIPARLSDGVSLASAGVSLTPVDEHGASMGGDSGAVVGASVFYGSTGTDSAVAVQPTSSGFDLQTLIYSANAPETYFFRVGLPAGAALTRDATGVVQVTDGGRPVAVIAPPNAQDAEGTSIPTSLSLTGDVLAVHVEHRAGSYLYPALLDPEVNDTQLATTTSGKRSNWEPHTSSEARFGHKMVYEGVGKEYLETSGLAEYAATEWVYWGYETKGTSKIYELKTKTSAKNTGARIESFLEFMAPGAVQESKVLLSTEVEGDTEYTGKAVSLCAVNAEKKQECLPPAGKEKNAVHFQQSAVRSPESNYKFSDTLTEGIVSISEPAGTHATTGFNTTSPEVEGEVEVEGKKVHQRRQNVLYAAGGWLSKYQGALEPIAKDAGIGVSRTKFEYENAGKWEQLSEHSYLENENACQGVQCYAAHNEYWTLDPKLPDGEDKIRYAAEEAMGGTRSLEGEGVATVKVDTKAPHSIFLHGLPWGNELAERPYTLSAEASDGEGSTVTSSGVKSLKLFISGREVAELGKQTGCSVAKGECTAKAEWTINGAELGAGRHAIVIVALDNAGNEERLADTLAIRHSTPVALGPGSVDLQSGDYALGATDVSLGSGLTLSRNYSSRDLTQGSEGPLGPQWSASLSSMESLTEMVDGSVLLTAANGSQSVFATLGEGKFEAPVGDSNLSLTLEENKETKEKLAYYLADAAAGTLVKFTRPHGTTIWVPTRQEGTVATDTVTFAYRVIEPLVEYGLTAGSGPHGITSGPDGNLWFADSNTGKLGKITTSGLITEYSAVTNGSKPNMIVAGPDNNLWYTNSLPGQNGTEKSFIGKVTTSGVVTEYALPNESGPTGITPGPDGNLWFTDNKTGKIGKITTSGAITEYSAATNGSKPNMIVAGPDNNLWYTNSLVQNGTEKSFIGKVTTSGVVTEYALPNESGPTGITPGPDGNLWFADTKTGKVGKITTAGAVTEYALPSRSQPNVIVKGPDNNLWFTDDEQVVNGETEKSRIGKITAAGTVSEYAIPINSHPVGIAGGSDGNLWFVDYGTNKIGRMTTAGLITDPTEALAPVPSGVSCTPMKEGCRALKFVYATKTTAAGEQRAEWGEYDTRLARVLLAAYNPKTKKMEEPAVAEYSYDKQGRLRAEWDPRISPALKTSYGYDEEGHITALTAPGQESWSFTYGTIPGDQGTGRLIKATQAPAAAELWKGVLPENTEGPKITGAAMVGVRLAVSNGSWSGGPVDYAYKWEDCNSEGVACATISGATNANYTVTYSDVGHTIRAVVSATNGGGSVTATSSQTVVVTARSLTQVVDSGNGINAASCVPGTTYCVVSDSKGNSYSAPNVSTNLNSTWTARTGPGTSPSEAVDCPTELMCLLADGAKSGFGGNLYYSTLSNGAWSPWTTAYSPEYGVDAISCPSSSFCVAAQDGGGYFRYSTSPASPSWTLESQGSAAMKAVYCLSSSFCAIADGAGSVHIATSTTQIESSSWTSTDVDGTTALNGVACTSTTSCVAVDGAGNVLNLAVGSKGEATATKHNIDGTNSLTAVTCTGTTCVTVDNHGNVLVSTNSGETWTSRFQLSDDLTSISCASSSLCVTADTTGNVTALNPGIGTLQEGEARPAQPGATMEYGVPIEGAGAPQQMGLNPTTHKPEPEAWGQKDDPIEASAIVPPDSPQGWPASSYTRATVYYLDSKGRLTNTSTPSTAPDGSISTTEYNEENNVIRTLSVDNRQTALEAGGKSTEVAKLLDTQNTYNGEGAKELEVSEPGTRLIETRGPQHMIKYMAGKEMKESLARNHIKYFYDEGAPAGETYDLLTKKTDLAQLANEEEVEVRKTTTSYSGQENLGWKLRAPTSVIEDPEGKKNTRTTLYNAVTGQITETRGAAGQAGNSAHDEKTVYYSSEENKEGYSGCGLHPEWSGLVCETLPAKQPETPGLPKLPVTTTTYNIWNEPATVVETFSRCEVVAEGTGRYQDAKCVMLGTGNYELKSYTRTKTYTYDEAGRLASSETTSTSTEDKALPKLTDEYNSKTGVLEKQSTTVEGKTKTITNVYNTLGQLTSYTDADGNVAKYAYASLENDGLLEEMTDSSNGGSRQTFAYNTTTKQLEKLWDSAVETFSATYDAEGKMTSEIYPNGMCANTKYNSVGESTHIEYIKTTNCSEEKPAVWFSETRSPSVRGETFTRESTLARETYGYDTLGRLTEAQETPSGSGCAVRAYAYDEESNRTSLTTRAPGSKGECLTEGGTVENHTYDEGNRLTDAGIEYDALGNIKRLPATDAEGHELTSTFYVSNAVASQTQNGVTNSYTLDPTGRIAQTESSGKTTTSHYDAPGEAVAWTSESSEKWTRNIPGISGALCAVQINGATPVLQLHDLQGNIVATASLSKEAGALLTTYNSTEFGAPIAEKAPPKYAWLGAGFVSDSLSSGVITYGATSYVPQTGRPLQSEEVEPPGAPGGTGAGAAYSSQEEPWNMQGAAREATEAPGLEAGREHEAALAACKANPEACVVDPHVSGLVSGTKMDEFAEYLSKKAANGRLYAEWASLVPYVGEIVKQLGMSYTDIIELMAANAAGCALHVAVITNPHMKAMCYIKYWYEVVKVNMWFIKITLEYPLSLTTEVCGKHRGEFEGYYYCWNQHTWYRSQGVK